MAFLIPILSPILFPIAFWSTLLDILTKHVDFSGSVFTFFCMVIDKMHVWL